MPDAFACQHSIIKVAIKIRNKILTISRHIQLHEILKVLNVLRQSLDLIIAEAKLS